MGANIFHMKKWMKVVSCIFSRILNQVFFKLAGPNWVGKNDLSSRPIPRSEVPVASAKLVNIMSSGIAVPSLVPKKSIKKQWEQF